MLFDQQPMRRDSSHLTEPVTSALMERERGTALYLSDWGSITLYKQREHIQQVHQSHTLYRIDAWGVSKHIVTQRL